MHGHLGRRFRSGAVGAVRAVGAAGAVAAALAAWVAAAAAAAGPPEVPGALPAPSAPAGGAKEVRQPAASRVGRADLAAAYMRLEEALAAAAPAGEARARVNREFDGLTLEYFAGRMERAVALLDALSVSLLESAPDPAARERGRRLRELGPRRVRAAPRTLPAAEGGAVEVDVAWLSGEPAGAPVVARLRPADGSAPLPVTLPGEGTVTVKLPGDRPPQAWTLELEAEPPLALARVWTLPQPLDATRTELLARISRLESEAQPAAAPLLGAVRARAQLLTASPGRARLAESLVDPLLHAREVEADVTALESGRDPFHGRAGVTWRTISVSGVELPMRIVAPASALARGEALPLVVALHGAGGDENMFIDGYGRGALVRLAERHGFLVAAPLTTIFATSPAFLDAVVATMSDAYPVDPRRVHVLGHSMGAAAAGAAVRARPALVASAALLAGTGAPVDPGRAAGPDVPPIRIDAGALDPLIPAASLRKLAERLRQAGVEVTLVEWPEEGHTLLVERALPDAVEWLMAHPRPAPAPPPAPP